jgi:hypothetical protein
MNQMTPVQILIAFGRKLESLGDSDISEAIETDEELQVLVAMFVQLGGVMQAQGFLSVDLEEIWTPEYQSKLQATVAKYMPQ